MSQLEFQSWGPSSSLCMWMAFLIDYPPLITQTAMLTLSMMTSSKALTQFKAWTHDRQMPLNDSKCTILHLDKNNIRLSYAIGSAELGRVEKGIIWNNHHWRPQVLDAHKQHCLKNIEYNIQYVKIPHWRYSSSCTILILESNFSMPRDYRVHSMLLKSWRGCKEELRNVPLPWNDE